MHYGNEVYSLLKVIHVLLASLWVGGSFYFAAIVAPNLAQSTPTTRREFGGRLMNVGLRFANSIGGLTVLTGIILFWLLRDGFTMASNSDRLLVFGLFIGLASLYLINVVTKPTLKRVATLTAEQAPGEAPPGLVLILQKRLRITSLINVVFLMVAVIVMVLADTHVLDP